MKHTDRQLGMGGKITRRDLLQGMGLMAGAAMLPGSFQANASTAVSYPPGFTGMRGNHPGSWEVAHALARNGVREWGPSAEPDSSDYDLVVVGAGISGLAAAHFWLQKQPGARILLLDNHDDFGGHARRNEFIVGDRTLIGYGGSQTMVEPASYPEIVKGMLRDLKVDPNRFDTAYDHDFYRRHNLAAGLYFNPQAWGKKTLLRYHLGTVFMDYVPISEEGLSTQQAVAQMPLSPAAKTQLLSALMGTGKPVDSDSEYERYVYLSTMSYKDFMARQLGITEPEAYRVLQDLTYDSGLRIDSSPALFAILYSGLPGLEVSGLVPEEAEPYIHHFPDGNASIARLLVRRLIPATVAGNNMDDIVTAPLDYGKLDLEDAQVRLRLNSTVIEVAHRGEANTAKNVDVSYVRAGQRETVRAKHCILACYNAMIPALCPELPTDQQEALSKQVKMPLLYNTVAVNNWQPWKTLGVGAIMAPDSYHTVAKLDFPVSIGDYQYSEGPDKPALIHMEAFLMRDKEGRSRHQLYREGRKDLLVTPFADIERNIREQLTGMLGEGGFDPAADIAGITVNRWAHGYSSWYSPLEDEFYEDWNDPRYPHVRARQPYGRIGIANSDAGASAMMESAIMQAHRAVGELA
ncbi:MAG: FAD/NAD(P)-binding protein [Pseudomonadota bacterium]